MTPARPLERPPPDLQRRHRRHARRAERRDDAEECRRQRAPDRRRTPAAASRCEDRAAPDRLARRACLDDGRAAKLGKEQTRAGTRRRRRARSRPASAESSRPRLAPIDRRRAISRSRAAVRARNRLATFEPAISRTSAAIAARIQSDRSNCCRSGDGPLAAGPQIERRLEEARDAAPASGLGPSNNRGAYSRRKLLKAACTTLCACSTVNAVLQASEDAEPAELGVAERSRVVHRVRQPQIRRTARLDAGERALGHPDDLELDASLERQASVRATAGSPPNRRIQNAWLTTATGCAPGWSSSCTRDQPAGRRPDAEPLERVARDDTAFAPVPFRRRRRRTSTAGSPACSSQRDRRAPATRRACGRTADR